jgi:methyl-accepting chemotaxis protein
MNVARAGKSLSIRFKLFMLISSVVAGLVALLALYFVSRQVAMLERTALGKGELLAHQVRTSVAFDDKETAREVFEAAHQSPEILHLALFRADGGLLYADGSGDLRAPAAVTASRLEVDGNRMRVVAPVVSVEGPRGALVIELDRARLQADIRAVRLGALAIGGAGLLAGLLAAWLVGTSFARRIERVTRSAAAVAAGDLSQPHIEEKSRDEIGQLAEAFNAMVGSLNVLVQKLSETSAQLEGASDSFLDVVRFHGDDMRDAAQRVEEVIRQGASQEGLNDAVVHVERLAQGARGVSDGLVPGFIELREYADHLNGVIGGFKVTQRVPEGQEASA